MTLAWMLAMGMTMTTATVPDDYHAQTQQWRDQRVARLTAPDGWLSLVGLHWVDPGTHRVGRAADNDIVLAAGPDHAGTLTLADDGARFAPHAHARFTVDGKPADAPFALLTYKNGGPTRVLFDGGGGFELHPHGDGQALRVRHPDAPTRRDFAGLDWYPIDADWRIDARYEPHPPGKTIDIASVTGALEPTPNPGAVVFERDGRTYRLEALEGPNGTLFVILADRTSGRETYGAGRFVYTDPPADGRVVLDFNRLYNPPCAFTEFSTCPLPPPENRLDIAITAGEKKYPGTAH